MLPSLPGLPVSPYGLVFAATVLGVIFFGIRAIQRDGSYPPYLGYQLALLCLLGHGIGGRVVYARTHWGHLLEDWPRLLDVSLGGSTHLESVLCSVALWIVLLRLRRVSLRDLMDLAAPITMAGQAVGRSACLVAGCCFGTPTAVPWAITFTRKLCSVFWQQWASSGVSPNATCQRVSYSSSSRACWSVRSNISLRIRIPATVCTGLFGRPLSTW